LDNIFHASAFTGIPLSQVETTIGFLTGDENLGRLMEAKPNDPILRKFFLFIQAN